MDSDLLKEAIADAKAVRQTALANAKVALEEAFNDRYQRMFAEKLKEEAGTEIPQPEGSAPALGEDTNVSGQEIDELIKELEAEVGGENQPEDPMNNLNPEAPVGTTPPAAGAIPPAPVGAPGAVPPVCPPGCIPAPVGAPGAVPAPVDGAPIAGAAMPPVAPAPVDGVTPPAPGALPPSGTPPVDDDTQEVDEEINLDELLESLKAEVDKDSKEEEEKIDEVKKLTSSGIASSDNKKPASGASSSSGIESGGGKDNGVPEGKTVTKDATEASRPNEAKNATSTNLSTPSLGGSSGPALKAARPNSKGEFENTSKLHEENVTLKKQLDEAVDVIKYVKGQLNEVNLLNAKLLYTNKLFKEFGMPNEQKMRVVEMFDLAKNVREVKLTYANIAESLNFGGNDKKRVASAPNSSVQSITEGLASKSVSSTKPAKELISESKSNQMVAHFQKLAGIKLPSTK